MPPPSDPTTAIRRAEAAGQVRAIDAGGQDGPTELEGLAIPYGVPYRLPWGEEETIGRGAFRDSVAQWRSRKDARPAYLDRHGGSPVAAIHELRDTTEGVRFRATLLRGSDGQLTAAAREYVTQVLAGITGASVEYMPAPGGSERTKDGYRITRGSLLAVAGAHAPAYDSARVQARSQEESTVPPQTATGDTGPVDFAGRLDAMRTDALAEVRSITTMATTENRELTAAEDCQLRAAQDRSDRIGRQSTAYAEERARIQAERGAASTAAAGQAVRVTRHESVYRGEQGISWFRDLMHARSDPMAAERMSRHRAMVADLAAQIESRAIDSADLGGTLATQYAPELYVPDLAYSGPLFAFFARTPISNSAPIVVPTFGAVTGDTGPQAAENDPLPSIDITTSPKTATPMAVGGEAIVSRQVVDGASPGADLIIGAQLRELLMRDQERTIAAVLELLPVTGTITDTGGTGSPQSGRDLERGLRVAVARMLGTRFLPAEGVFANATDYQHLAAGEDLQGRPIMPIYGPMNTDSTMGPGFAGGYIAGVPAGMAWAIVNQTNDFVARRNDAHTWASTILDIKLTEREGPQSIVFAVWQYLAFAVLQPKGVARWTYTNVLADEEVLSSGLQLPGGKVPAGAKPDAVRTTDDVKDKLVREGKADERKAERERKADRES
jgi:HK97 family phage major capsid protein